MVVILTEVVLGIFLSILLWMVLSPNPPVFFYVSFSIIGCALMLFLIINIVLLTLESNHRKRHIITIAVISLVVLIVFPCSAKLAGIQQRRWFFGLGIRAYDAMAATIVENKQKLSDSETYVGDLV